MIIKTTLSKKLVPMVYPVDTRLKRHNRVRSRYIFDKFLTILSGELTKLKSLLKFYNQPVVPLDQVLGPIPSQPELKLQPYELNDHVKTNGCVTYFDKTDKKLHVLQRNVLERYGNATATSKQYEISRRTTVPKGDDCSVAHHI